MEKTLRILEFFRHRLFIAVNTIRTFKNWYLCFLDYFGFLKNKRLVFYLRNGAQYTTKGGCGSFRIIADTWILKQYTPDLKFAIKDGFVVIDGGANIGSFSIYAAKSAQDVKVLSYEPVRENFEALLENIRINKLSNIEAFNHALSGKIATKKIFLAESRIGDHSFSRKTNKCVEVECLGIKDTFERNKIVKCNLLKLDVEGAEYEILFNTPREFLNRIQLICLEFHDDLTNKYSHQDLIEFLCRHGFNVKKHNRYNILYAENKAFENPIRKNL